MIWVRRFFAVILAVILLAVLVGAVVLRTAKRATDPEFIKAELVKVGATLDAIRKDSHDGQISMLAHEKDLARWKAEAERVAERRADLERERTELEAALAETSRELEDTLLARGLTRCVE